MAATLPGESVCIGLEERLAAEVGAARFEQFFSCVRIEATAGAVRVLAPSMMYARWLSKQFGEALDRAARTVMGRDAVVLEWSVDPELGSSLPPSRLNGGVGASPGRGVPPAAASASSGQASQRHPMPVQFSFEGFVVSEGNRLAHAMSLRLADPGSEPPARVLFIHGDCGVGKTHLLCATARAYRQADPRARVRYVTAEDFTNEFIASIHSGKPEAFRSALRRLDLLCIDDVQFLGPREKTQQEFLHTFDALHRAEARIALASDSAPRDLEDFSRRLASRCNAGMVVGIRPPDEATRRKIVVRLARVRNLVLDDACVEVLLGVCGPSIRDAEGLVAQLRAYCDATPGATGPGGVVEGWAVRRMLDAVGRSLILRRPVRLERIIEAVCARYGVEREEIRRRRRVRQVVEARSVIAYLARELTTHSYPEIAQAVGCGSHSTMIEGASRVKRMVEQGDRCAAEPRDAGRTMRELCDQLKRSLGGVGAPPDGTRLCGS